MAKIWILFYVVVRGIPPTIEGPFTQQECAYRAEVLHTLFSKLADNEGVPHTHNMACIENALYSETLECDAEKYCTLKKNSEVRR